MSINLHPENELEISNEVDYFKKFELELQKNHYKYGLQLARNNNDRKRDSYNSGNQVKLEGTKRAGRPRSATMPTNKLDWLNLNFDHFVNEMIKKHTYTSLIWYKDLKPKGLIGFLEHKVYVGYDEDFGPLFVTLYSQDSSHVVYLYSNWGSSKVVVDNAMITPSSVNITQSLTPRAYKIILFLAFEKYLEELENQQFSLKSWQQSIDFLSPCYGDNLYKFANDKRGYQRDFLQDIDSSVTLFQLIKSDLPRFVGQLELVENEQLERTLKNLDRKIMQKSVTVDVIIHHSGLNRTMEQRDTFNAFIKICGEPLVQNGSSITREELINPTIISETSDDPTQLIARRRIIFQELLDSETKYVNKLKAIVEVFIKPLRNLADKGSNLIRHYDIKATFQYIEDILEVNQAFLLDLQSYDPETSNLGEICLKHAKTFEIYEPYISGYRYSLEYNVTLERKNNFYYNFVMKARDHPECFKLALKDLLVMPVQRVPRYNLLFSDYLRFTPKDDPEYDGLYKALVKINEISYLASHRLSEKAEELSRLLFSIADCPPKIMSSSRHFVTQFDCIEADITTLSGQDNITLFLLSDCLIITKRNKDSSSTKKKSFHFISWIDLNGLEVLDAEPYGNMHALYFKGSLEYSEDLYWDHQEIHMFSTIDASDKARFYNELVTTTAICKAKSKSKIS
ncbi:Dbl homology domain-containing protein [Neoconidiobolus thromboides FSU 785]|nr:Dbl homology domain-containing protein [Neoconidiobolus thromboides FSU 785]